MLSYKKKHCKETHRTRDRHTATHSLLFVDVSLSDWADYFEIEQTNENTVF